MTQTITSTNKQAGYLHSSIPVGKFNPELLLSIVCGVLLLAGFSLSFFRQVPDSIRLICFAGAYLAGGSYAARKSFRTVIHGRFDIDFLMLVAAAGAAVLDKWSEGALLLFLFSMGNALEHIALDKARKTIRALTDLTPRTALLKQKDQLQEIPVESIRIGDIILVLPNTKIAADGIVVSGSSSVDQAPITGESMPVDKMPAVDQEITNGAKADSASIVFAGTINGSGTMEIKVTRKNEDSTLSRLVKMVTEAQEQKSPTQQFADRIEKYYVPLILILVAVLCLAFLFIDETFSSSFYRAMAVLIGASPCALAISTPGAVLSGVARAAREGVLIKGGKPLEDLGMIHIMAFDKTGTLTEGRPRLTAIVPLPGIAEKDLLAKVIAIEKHSDHPLAKAIVRDGLRVLGDYPLPAVTQLHSITGKGIKALAGDGDLFYAGNLALFQNLDFYLSPADLVAMVHALEEKGNTTMIVRQNTTYLGCIALMDAPRAEARQAIADLEKLGIQKMVMLTGDNQKVADSVALQIGIKDARGGLLPEQKVAVIATLAEKGNRIAMVGDGVNDAPAMAKSTVGIAMGAAGSDVALETADVALLGDKLYLLPFAIGLSRKAKIIIRQNLFISLGMVALLVPLTIMGITGIGPAVIGHEGSTVVVVLNALRLLGYKFPKAG